MLCVVYTDKGNVGDVSNISVKGKHRVTPCTHNIRHLTSRNTFNDQLTCLLHSGVTGAHTTLPLKVDHFHRGQPNNPQDSLVCTSSRVSAWGGICFMSRCGHLGAAEGISHTCAASTRRRWFSLTCDGWRVQVGC